MNDDLKGLLEGRTEIVTMRWRDLLPLPKEENARYMTDDQFKKLVENIKHDGVPTSVPLVMWNEERNGFEILSGNHRVQATLQALGVNFNGPVMRVTGELTKAERLRLQLSHNAIEGQDDPAILKRLFDEMGDVTLKSLSGLDDKQLDLLEKVDVGGLSEADFEYQTLQVIFLPEDMSRIQEVVEEAKAMVTADSVWLAHWNDYNRVLEALDFTSKSYQVKAVADSLAIILNIFEQHVTDLADGYCSPEGEAFHSGWVPTTTLLGWDVPAEAAVVMRKAIAKIIEAEGDIKPWQALELLCADFLGS